VPPLLMGIVRTMGFLNSFHVMKTIRSRGLRESLCVPAGAWLIPSQNCTMLARCLISRAFRMTRNLCRLAQAPKRSSREFITSNQRFCGPRTSLRLPKLTALHRQGRCTSVSSNIQQTSCHFHLEGCVSQLDIKVPRVPSPCLKLQAQT
jgi:hypothetical protein